MDDQTQRETEHRREAEEANANVAAALRILTRSVPVTIETGGERLTIKALLDGQFQLASPSSMMGFVAAPATPKRDDDLVILVLPREIAEMTDWASDPSMIPWPWPLDADDLPA